MGKARTLERPSKYRRWTDAEKKFIMRKVRRARKKRKDGTGYRGEVEDICFDYDIWHSTIAYWEKVGY